jgi:hypothetical protein
MRRLSRVAALATVTLVACVLAAVASADWSTQAGAGPLTISAATLSPPSALTATRSCVRNVRNWVVLRWTATPSSFATGYEIFRASGSGSPASIATVSGRGTVTYTDKTVSSSRTYSYTVQATYLGWSSVPSNTATITTPRSNCR